MAIKNIQRNGYMIHYSRTYDRWQVSKNKRVLEEFVERSKAIEWAENN